MFVDALLFVLSPVTWAFDLFSQMLTTSNALPIYLGIFLVYTVSRLFIRRWIGDSSGHKED